MITKEITSPREMPEFGSGALPESRSAAAPQPDNARNEPYDARWPRGPAVQKDRVRRAIASRLDDSWVRDIQRQHRQIFALIHEYQVRAMADVDGIATLSLLVRIVDRVENNFASEESRLEDLDQPMLHRQRAAHQAILAELRHAVEDWRKPGFAGGIGAKHVVDSLLVYYFGDDPFIDY